MNEEDKIYQGKDVKYGLKKALKLGYKDGLKEGFQKGKLEQKKEDIREFNKFVQELKDIEIWDCSPDEYLDRINQCKRKLDKQLQKEIGEEKK